MYIFVCAFEGWSFGFRAVEDDAEGSARSERGNLMTYTVFPLVRALGLKDGHVPTFGLLR